VPKLREADRLLSEGKNVAEVAKELASFDLGEPLTGLLPRSISSQQINIALCNSLMDL
jgi:hypothetical protein